MLCLWSHALNHRMVASVVTVTYMVMLSGIQLVHLAQLQCKIAMMMCSMFSLKACPACTNFYYYGYRISCQTRLNIFLATFAGPRCTVLHSL